MKKHRTLSLLAAAVLTASVGLALAQTSAGGLTTLRPASIEEETLPPGTAQIDEGRFTRNYRQQPPLIPHEIDQYQIDLNANRCLSCHDWTNAADRQAPTLSMTHYMDREGNQLDTIAAGRWFCNQCHVPQADVPELVGNVFESSTKN